MRNRVALEKDKLNNWVGSDDIGGKRSSVIGKGGQF